MAISGTKIEVPTIYKAYASFLDSHWSTRNPLGYIQVTNDTSTVQDARPAAAIVVVLLPSLIFLRNETGDATPELGMGQNHQT
jgi:hypothetical protein